MTSMSFKKSDKIWSNRVNNNKIFILYQGEVSERVEDQTINQVLIHSVFGVNLHNQDLKIHYKAIADTDSKVLVIKQSDYNSIISDSLILQRIKNTDFIDQLEILNDWDDMKKQHFHNKIKTKIYSHNETIFEQGDLPDAFYI